MECAGEDDNVVEPNEKVSAAVRTRLLCPPPDLTTCCFLSYETTGLIGT
jgi:hypothetical protein